MENTDRSNDTEDCDNEDDSISELIAQVWYHHGLFCASHPKLIIFLSAVVVLTCSAPLFTAPGFSVPVTEERTTKTVYEYGQESFLPPWLDGKPLVYIAQFVLTTHISPWMTTVQSHEIMKQVLKPAFHVTKIITDYKDKESLFKTSDMCLNVTSDKMIRQRSGLRLQDHQFLPASGCLLLSPANLWNRNLERFTTDKEVFDKLNQNYGRPAFNILLKEFIFGMSLKQTGLYPKLQGSGHDNSVRYAITLITTSHQQSYMDGLTLELKKRYPLGVEPGKSDQTEHDQVVHIYYKGDYGSLVEMGPISVAYFVVFLYLAFSVGKIEMVKSKWGLAFSAVITVVASLVMAGGLSTFFGLVPNLHSSEVFPYLVIMVGVENTLVITKSVVSTPVDLDVKIRVAQGLSKEGKYMMKNLATEMFVIGLGYFTFVPAIQEFCLFALIGLLTDFFLQVFLFSTILSIDIRRMEISDLDRVSIQQQVLKRNKTSQLNTRDTSILKTSSTESHPTPRLLPPLPADSIKTPSLCPVIPGKSKRLKLVNFWARTRMVQRACMIFAVLYFIYMVFYSVTPNTFRNLTSDQPDQNVEEEMSLSKIIEKIVAEYDTNKNQTGSNNVKAKNKEDLQDKGRQDTKRSTTDSHRTQGDWKGLSKYHWPQLLSYYNISILGRYISILPPVHLGFKIDSQTLAVKEELMHMPKADRPSVSLPAIQDPDPSDMSLNSRDPEYYLNALNCVVLGVIVMIILFFICKYLNDLQIRPKSRSLTGVENMVEAIPLSLRRHPQNVEHMKCTVSTIVSICLSGQIRIWDRTTGECIKVIDRSSDMPSIRRRRTSKTVLKKKGNQDLPDKNYTRSKYFKSLENGSLLDDKPDIPIISSPDVFSAPDSAVMPPNTSDVNGLQAPSSPEGCKSRTGSGSGLSDNSGYDFGPYCPTGGSARIGTWGSSHSLDNSWSSEEDYPDHLFSGSDEDLYQEMNRTQGRNERRDEGLYRRASVWCLDCKDDVLATGCSDGYVELWSLSSGRQICLYCENSNGVTSVAFLPDSPQIVVARIDGTLDFLTLLYPAMSSVNNFSPFKRSSPRAARKNPNYDTTTNDVNPVPTHTLPVMCNLTHRVRAHHQPASVMVVTKENVVTGSHDRTLKVFRTNDGGRIFTLHGHRDGITALKVLETDPSRVLSGASNGGVRVWDLTSGECLQHLRGHTCSVTALACTQNNIISVSIDNSMCIWDRHKGKCIHYKLKQFPVLCSNIIMLSNNLFVTGGQGCIVLWDLHAGKQVKTIPLDNGDSSILVRNVNICDTATVVCSYGKELRVVTFPSVINKAE